MPLIQIKEDLRLNVEIMNPDGCETVVMVHGMFGNLSHFYLTLAPFISKRYKVVIFDLKSHGRSDRAEYGYDLKSLAEDVRALMDSLEIDKAHLLGFSYGALIAIEFSILHPNRVGKVVAIEVPDKPDFPFKARGTYTFEDFWGFVIYLNENVKKNFFRSKRQIVNTFKVYDYMFNHTTFSQDTNNEPEFTASDYARVKAPVMLCYGRKSLCFHELERIGDWISDVQVYIDEGDHGFFMENVEVFSEQVTDFLLGNALQRSGDSFTMKKATVAQW